MKHQSFLIYGAMALSLFTFSQPVNADDIGAGQNAYNRCKSCHTVEEGKNRVGPSLFEIMGRTPGTVEGFRYSPAMKAFGSSGVVWDEATLNAFLEAPRTLIPKNRMGFPGLKSAEARANLIAYLKSVSGD
ncbi:MAG: c-type cytochrome [Alphaproteobacteria bacterium]